MKSPLEPARPPVGDDCPTAFTRSAAAEVAEATRYVRNLQRNRPIFPGRGPRATDGGSLYRLTATLSAATALTSITNASAVPQTFSGTTVADGSGTATLYNYHDKTFASGAIVWAESGTGGKLWVLDVRSCTSVS